jgi:hypothetical protein
MVMTGLVRAATSEPEAAGRLRELIAGRLIGPLATRLAVDHADLRASLAAAQVVGLTMARDVVGLPPVAAASHEELVDLLAPVFELLLVGAAPSGRAREPAEPPAPERAARWPARGQPPDDAAATVPRLGNTPESAA